jgi:hypothetical protein
MQLQKFRKSAYRAALAALMLSALSACSLRRLRYHGNQIAYYQRVDVTGAAWTPVLTNQAGYIVRVMVINAGSAQATLRAQPVAGSATPCIQLDQTRKIDRGAMLYVTLDAGCELEAQIPGGRTTIEVLVEHGIEKLPGVLPPA